MPTHKLPNGQKITKEMFIHRILGKLPSAYAHGSVVERRVAKGLSRLTMDELDSLLAIVSTLQR